MRKVSFPVLLLVKKAKIYYYINYINLWKEQEIIPEMYMSETFIELLIKRKTNVLQKGLQYFFMVLTVIAILLGIMGSPTLLLVGILFGVITYFAKMYANVEFEYLYLNKELTVDRILGESKRKKMAEFHMQRMEILAPSDSHRLDSYRNKKCVNYDFTSKQEKSKPYTFIYAGDNEVAKVSIDMTDELFKAIRDISPRKVFSD